jgi:hypothetical protein
MIEFKGGYFERQVILWGAMVRGVSDQLSPVLSAFAPVSPVGHG